MFDLIVKFVVIDYLDLIFEVVNIIEEDSI